MVTGNWELNAMLLCLNHHYRPQRSCEGYVFTPVCLSTGGICLSACWDTTPWDQAHPSGTRHTHQEQAPPGADTPQEQTSPQEQAPPLGADTPRADTPSPQDQAPPQEQAPPRQTPPDQASPPQQTATVADDTHPTGMHSCYLSYHLH